jgi:hypothetical protein
MDYKDKTEEKKITKCINSINSEEKKALSA